MNTIPLIFNERQIDRTVLGGSRVNANAKMNISVIMINSSGSQFRIQTIEKLLNCGFKSIVSFEPDSDNFNIEDISHRFPDVKFVIPLEKVSTGDLINMGMSEVDSEYVLVIKDTINVPGGILLPNLAERLTKDSVYCVVPRMLNYEKQSIPIQFVPSALKGKFRVDSFSYVVDGMPTLYPFDYVGLYNRDKFIKLGGFDYTITNPYWQNLDLSLRAWLWGERIQLSTTFQLSYTTDEPIENYTPDLSYLRFYLKNILPKFKADHGVISPLSFFLFMMNSSCGVIESIRQFSDAKNWVEKNKYRFTCDVQNLIEMWEQKQ